MDCSRSSRLWLAAGRELDRSAVDGQRDRAVSLSIASGVEYLLWVSMFHHWALSGPALFRERHESMCREAVALFVAGGTVRAMSDSDTFEPDTQAEISRLHEAIGANWARLQHIETLLRDEAARGVQYMGVMSPAPLDRRATLEQQEQKVRQEGIALVAKLAAMESAAKRG